MENVIVIADNFHLLHIGHQQLLKSIEKLMTEYEISKCIIFINDENGDKIGFPEKEALLRKIISSNPNFEIYQVETLKIFKELKQLELDGKDVLAVFTEPLQESYIKNSLVGIPTEVRTYKHNIDINEVEETILTGTFQEYCKLMPQCLYDEFQNLKEIYNMNKLTEEISMDKITVDKKSLENYLSDAIDKHMVQIEESKSNEMVMNKKDFVELVEKIINEKLKGQEFDDMHKLKLNIISQINKMSKTKWAMSVSGIGQKENGNYVIKLTGSGNNILNIFWGEGISGDFAFSTSTSLIAGDEFSTKLYFFMVNLIEKKDQVIKMLDNIMLKFTEIQEKGYDEELEDNIEDVEYEDNSLPVEEVEEVVDVPTEEEVVE